MRAVESVIVEFAGLPGAGKSTLSHALAAELRRTGEPVGEPTYDLTHRTSTPGRRRAKLGFLLRTLATRPRESAAALREIHATRQASVRDAWSTSANLLYLCGLVAELARRPGLHVLDQGLVNALWSVAFSARAPCSLVRLGEIAGGCFPPLTRIVVLLEVPPELAVERLRARARRQSRLERTLSEDPSDAVRAALAAFEGTRAALGELRRGSWRTVGIVRVDGAGASGRTVTPEDLAGTVRDVLRQLLRRDEDSGTDVCPDPRDASRRDPAGNRRSIVR